MRHHFIWSRLTAFFIGALIMAVPTSVLGVNADASALSNERAKEDYARITRAIIDKETSWEGKVELLRRRGALLSQEFLLDAALSDFREAASLAPHYSMTHLDIATALTKLGRYPEAYASFRDGFQANPANLVLFMTRGMAHFNDGKFKRARRDLRRHLKFSKDDMYRMLWLSLAESRLGGDGKGELRKYANESKSETWPKPLVSLYLGERSVEDVLAVIDADKGAGAKERRCEAYFFIGQWHRTNGDETLARTYFEKTVDTRARGIMEYASARLALAL
jgi:lipoprotein NlpI